MFGQRIDLIRLLGIPVRVDLSWALVALLLTWSLAGALFPYLHPELPASTHLAMALAGVLGFFASIVGHELAHAVVARRYGLEIRGVTLFLFGGVAEMDGEPQSPEAEFMVAAAGPVASAGLAGVLALAWSAGLLFAWTPGQSVLGFLAAVNGSLAAFNLTPALPLDGGRILRAALWRWRGSLDAATRVTARLGTIFGTMLFVLGLLALVQGSAVAGVWWCLTGLFLRHAAGASYRGLLLRRALEGCAVGRLMKSPPVAVPRALSVADAVRDFVYRYRERSFPVVEGERLLGQVTLERIKELPREEWGQQTVGALAAPYPAEAMLTAETDAAEALRRLGRSGARRLPVVERERLVGTLALADLTGYAALKWELEGK